MTTTNTIEFLLSEAAKAGRLSRQAGYKAIGETTPCMVIHVETLHTGMQEIDATSEEHAEHLIETWITNLGAKSARHFHVFTDGSLCQASPIYDFRCYSDDY